MLRDGPAGPSSDAIVAKDPPNAGVRFLLANIARRTDPLTFLVRCAREYGDVVTFGPGSSRVVLVSHPDLIEDVLVRNARNFRKAVFLRGARRVLGESILTTDGESWVHHRRLILPSFRRDRLASYWRTMETSVRQWVDVWQAGVARDIYAELTRLSLAIATRTVLKLDPTESQLRELDGALGTVIEWMQAERGTLAAAPAWLPTPRNLAVRGALRFLDEFVYESIRRRRVRGDGGDDLLTALLQSRSEGGAPLTDKRIRDEIVTLLTNVWDPPAVVLMWCWYLLAQHPAVEARLAQELDAVLAGRPPSIDELPRLAYARRVLQETLRLYPAGRSLMRQAVRDCRIGEYAVPRDAYVLLSQWVVHRDPRYYADAESFDPDRWDGELTARLPRFAYFPFGGGPRSCLGEDFGMTEAQLVLATVAQRWRLVPVDRRPPGAPPTLRPRGPVPMIPRQRR